MDTLTGVRRSWIPLTGVRRSGYSKWREEEWIQQPGWGGVDTLTGVRRSGYSNWR